MKVPTAHQALVVTSLLLLGTSAFAQEERETPLDLPLETDASAIPRSSTARAVRNLAELVRLIKNNSFAVRTANAKLSEAEARRREARSLALPTLQLTGSVSQHLLFVERPGLDTSSQPPTQATTRSPSQGTSYDTSLMLRVPVLAPRTWYDWDASSLGVESSNFFAENAVRTGLATSLDALVSVLTGERLAAVSRESLSIATTTLELTREQEQRGLGTRVDVARALQEVAEATGQIVSVDERLERAYENLGLSLGLEEPIRVAHTFETRSLLPSLQGYCHAESTPLERPDVVAAARNLEFAKTKVKGVSYGYLPTLTATSEAKFWPFRELSPNGFPVTWTAGLTLSVPIFDGDVRASEAKRLESLAELANAQLREAERQAQIDVLRTQRGVEVAKNNLKVATATRDLASLTMKLAEERFRIGEVTSFDLIAQAKRVREAESDLGVKEFEVLRAEVASFLARASCEFESHS